MNKRLIFFPIICTVLHVSIAMGTDTLRVASNDTLKVKTDHSTLVLRSFKTEKLTTYKKDPAFNYIEAPIPSNWWQQFKHWLYDKLGNLFINEKSSLALKWLVILLGASALIFLVYKLLGMNIMHIFGKQSRSDQTQLMDPADNIHVIDFDTELNQAIESNNFKSAIRLLYLKSLKELTDKQYIDWQPGKTNQTYIQELSEKPFQDNFALLTNQFEYTWYGDFTVQKQHFTIIKEAFNTFNTAIK